MYRKINRFNWIACVWILIGLFDLVFGYITYAALMYIHCKNNVDLQIVVTICAAVGLIACLGWLWVSHRLNEHDWTRLNRIGMFAISWGLIHSIEAVCLFFDSKTPQIFSLVISGISLFLILTGIYVLRKNDLYLQFRNGD